jgi:hypothetical protein
MRVFNACGSSAVLSGWEDDIQETPDSPWKVINPGYNTPDSDTGLVIPNTTDSNIPTSPAFQTDPPIPDAAGDQPSNSATKVPASPSRTHPSAPDSAPAVPSRTGGAPPQPIATTPDPSPDLSAAMSILNLYNTGVAEHLPNLFRAISPNTPDGQFILDRLTKLFDEEPDCVEDVEAIIKVIPFDAFLRGVSQTGHVWDLRFLCVQRPGRLIDQGERARRLLKALAKCGSWPSGAPTPTTPGRGQGSPTSRVPIHRQEHGTAGGADLIRIFEGL